MWHLRPGDDVGPLDDWPFDSPVSDYVILSGTPRASGRLFDGGPGHVTRAGIWRCTAGAFTCTEQGTEMMTILSGNGQIRDHATGTITAFAAGDVLFSMDGRRVTWNIDSDVTKVFYAMKPGGY
ncbi:cupin domain-containing protein [Loktanella sp. SALINAS62]|uniref:cupin domain-containing protein n=1 Tax=Loktanella sp. SALINAS62 TaxID=2706124 RepID=UPI001B8D0889|nr:cupin domain-containing protein [Loktanella sp. SALINAS62]MBS1303081.1 DUF861 domain-containing protein [Loktanella sp. SALINAS62]